MRRIAGTMSVLFLLAGAAMAAQHQHSPYAGHEMSEIPSLTPEELAALTSGEGMGFAKPAELNHYPGPRHVLDLASELELDEVQQERTREIFDAMQARAIELGTQIVEAERHLNMRFANAHIDEASLREATQEIALLYGQLRYVHLEAHLQTRALLRGDQIDSYDRLRGYHHGS